VPGDGSAARPPVLLVPGWSDRARALKRLRAFLLAEGWAAVHAFDFADRFGSNIEHAAELAAVIAELRGAAGRLDVVAHSMGGLAVRHYLAGHPDGGGIRRVLFLATPHRGTWAAYLAWGRGGREMRPGSAFLRHLERHELPHAVRAFNVRTPLDLRVFPPRSAAFPPAEDAMVRFVSHQGLLRSSAAFAHVRRCLLAPGP
jgi:pimeloyl-ACP methyl ester carboxylesterase